MLSKAVVVVVASFLIVMLIYSLYSVPVVFANITRGPINCVVGEGPFGTVACCQTETDSDTGVEIRYCTVCDKGYTPPRNCSPRFQYHPGPVNQTGQPTPAGNALPPTGNNTGTPPLESIFKVPPGTTNAPPPAGNNTGMSPTASITKEHNVASPKVLGSPENATQQQQTSGHHHKGK